jgi:hypothetical protein
MRARTSETHLKRKNLILDQRKIDRARRLLGAATETEAITRALDAVSDAARFRSEVEAGLSKLVGRGGFADHFAPTAYTRPAPTTASRARR